MDEVEIWHNPRCSKSRTALELLRSKGVEPRVVLYLDAPPSRERLEEVLRLLRLGPRDVLRKGEARYAELGLGEPRHDDRSLVQALSENPVLIERPIVIAGGRAVLARPPERALEVIGAQRGGNGAAPPPTVT